ncbi:nitroreductase family protein [Dokdonia donghaensis]|uniref:Nitroreductase n=1 Tax=Dokdonia donghaensis DSW-1 TaxID=1300343 RepID=A0A0A2GVZ1_9FLAO|nr:nitroreductase family protein [Dokdonia donghaensis]ANH59057.1 Oxygen-insensitive NAD(P)H nitroreductase [Dokdonia donghaensis DSW-1]KGO06486.1 nitroreductase [Dokdonia donghaensis DSW-1]
MSFINAMQERYTTKVYDETKKIDPKHIEELKESLRLSPSSINSQPWKFTFVSDQDIKEKLSKVSWINTEKVTKSDTVVVFSRVDDLSLFEEQIKRELPQGMVDYYNENLKPLPKEQITSWFDKQVYLSVGVLLSACAVMGIDATPMEGIEPANYDKIIGNDGYATLVAVAIGYRDEEDFNQPSKNPKSRIALDKVVETI